MRSAWGILFAILAVLALLVWGSSQYTYLVRHVGTVPQYLSSWVFFAGGVGFAYLAKSFFK
jgi:hypothetical protein